MSKNISALLVFMLDGIAFCDIFNKSLQLVHLKRLLLPNFIRMKLTFLAFALICLVSAIQVAGQRDFRLPTNIHPTKYHLKLFVVLEDPLPDYEPFTATGEVTINITCSEETDEILLHAVNLTIFNETVKVFASDNSELPVNSLNYETDNDFFIISLNDALQSGQQYAINIKFIAPIPDYRLNGMYQDFYIDPDTLEKKYIATTLFAPYHSRRLFPNFDEPGFRAEYDVEVAHHIKYHAMANEIIIDSRPVEENPDYQCDIFKTTPSISSYIVAMIVSDVTYVEAPPTYYHNKTIRVYAAPHLIEKRAGDYAVNITDAVMAFLENRFLIEFPLDKLFSIALPNFFFSAMENIGMITYKEPVLLYLKNETTEDERWRVNYVISHELSHQWFGNIVACKWWAYVWLKEGFSTYYAYHGISHTNPELNPWEMFIPVSLEVAMRFDASNESHPLENFPPTSAAVADIYTAIPYQKGASILRMTSHFLTEEVFEEAIKLYVNRHQYAVAEQNDVFDALQETLDTYSNINPHIPSSMRSIMNSWCQQSKFPVIYVNRTSDFQLLLIQEEYSDEGPGTEGKTWYVPINLLPRSRAFLPGTVADGWIPQGVSSIFMDLVDDGPVIVNPDATGYYRVIYDEPMQQQILELLENDYTKIPTAGRSKLIDDAFQLALSSYLTIPQAMEVTKYLHLETNASVWMTLRENMNRLLKYLDSDNSELLKEYLLLKLTPVWEFIDEATSPGSPQILKELLIRWSCDLGHCIGFSEEEVAEFVKNLPSTSLTAKENQEAFFCSAITADDDNRNGVFDHLLSEYENPSTLFGRKQRLLKAMACTKNLPKLKWMVTEVFGESRKTFSLSESHQLLQILSKKELAAEILLDEIHSKFDIFFERLYKSGDNALYEIANNLDSNQRNSKKLTSVLEKLGEKDESNARLLRSNLGSSLRRQSLVKKQSHSLRKWLQENIATLHM